MSKQVNNQAQQQSRPDNQPSPTTQALAWIGSKAMAVGRAVFDDTFFQWLSHGSTEVANTLLHGHPAPVYSHYRAPSQGEPEQPDSMKAVETSPVVQQGVGVQAPTEKAPSPSTSIKPAVEPSPSIEPVSDKPTVTSHGPANPTSLGILDRHMADLKSLPEPKPAEQEMSM